MTTMRRWAALIALLTACSDSTAPVNPGVSSPQFTITVRFVDPTPPAPSVLTAFDQATARWQKVIIDSVGSVPIKLAAGACDSAQPALNETVHATTRATIGPKDGSAGEFFRERQDRSARLPESSRIPPPTAPDR